MKGLLVLLFVAVALGQDLVVKNSCSFGLWAEARGAGNSLITGETNFIKYVPPGGGTVSYTVATSGLASTRFWVKYGCDNNGANCLIGDQVPNYNIYPNGCPSAGCSPPLDSLFEATWGCKLGAACPSGSSSVTYFDTSQVDGYTLPYLLHITGNTQCDCTGSGCTNLQSIDGSRLNLANCPTNEDLSDYNNYPQYANQNLRYSSEGKVVACKSPCKHLTLPAVDTGLALNEGSIPSIYYCCPTPDPNDCEISQGCITPAECRAGPVVSTKYVTTVHQETTDVYAYTYDDTVGLHTCPASGVQYIMEYCPAGSPAYPLGASSPATQAPSQGACSTSCGSGVSCCNTYSNGPACYSPSQYTCAVNNLGENVLCPAGDSACGISCYSPSAYQCVGGNLQPA